MVCIREVQKDLKQSSYQLIVDKIRAHNLSGFFDIRENEIRCPGEGIIIFRGMQAYNSDSIKSLEGYDRAWVEEAQSLSQRSLDLLRPTLRREGAEMWFSWNPTSELDPIEKLLRGKTAPPNSIIRRVTWSDNPWLPTSMLQEMLHDRSTDPEKAAHVWDGAYQAAPSGAYYAALLAEAMSDGRVGKVPADNILETHVAFDLGNGPNMSLVFAQFVGREIRLIDYLEGNEEAAETGWPWYIKRLREKPYTYGKMILPHDARSRQRATGKGDEQILIDAGFRTDVVDRMDPGQRVKLVQTFIPKCWIDETRCADGLRHWRNYRANYDEKLRIDRGPLHNEDSHASDALGHLAQAYEEPRAKRKKGDPTGVSESAWMG